MPLDGHLPWHAETTGNVEGSVEAVFDYVDRPERLSAHMSRRSWQMLGSTMTIATDREGGRRVGSSLTLRGRVLGVPLGIDGVVVEREPPHRKAWETVGEPRLLVIGAYRMTIAIDARGEHTSAVTIAIDYAMPRRSMVRWLAPVLGPMYARWCVAKMLADMAASFA